MKGASDQGGWRLTASASASTLPFNASSVISTAPVRWSNAAATSPTSAHTRTS